MDKKDKTIKGIVLHPETGEILNELYEGDRTVRKQSIDYLKNVQEWKIEHYFKGHENEIKKWMKDLNMSEKALLFSIVPYISFNDCHLQYENGIDIGTEDLVKLSGMARGTVYETIHSLIKKDILYKGKNSKGRQYFINPWLFCKGNRINTVLQTMFKNYRIRVLDNKKWKDVKDYNFGQ
jgi:hypothetical protein